ncbi:NAD(P)H-binding protein [Amycolatopsis sp. H20-H5]|uniref:NAD(P)H-binding protein n=1 Tax=Amycolatopsis sp. H20-H5 TaxID=3046309 RepID=UPI002DB8A687|nr:NAD(P)H-binding protein [Amycolatopsis sp. H20-H5]MEC3977673.1 NAD(P)H-binding protein [Amycolatopsis sp. H20-H5]
MTILVTGATASVGRLVVDELVAAGAPVRALTVNPAKAALPDGVEVAKGYLGRPETLPAALEGVDMVYLAPLAHTVREFTELARAAGVRRVVALSGSNADEEPQEGSSGMAYRAVEDAVEAAGFDWTFVRPGAFMNNTLGWAESVRTRGVVRAPYGEARSTAIDLGDVAAVAAHVLLTDGHSGAKYTLSGPSAISQREQAAAIGTALGREVGFQELTRAEAKADWAAAGIPGEVMDWLLDGFADALAHPQVPTTTVEELTGRPALTYAGWAVANAAAFR